MNMFEQDTTRPQRETPGIFMKLEPLSIDPRPETSFEPVPTEVARHAKWDSCASGKTCLAGQ